jgi:hypothetical protein
MGSTLDIRTLGLKGVNVDKDPLELDDDQLRQAQNAIHDPLGVNAGLRKRLGLTPFNLSTLGGTILGGIGVPIISEQASGTPTIYIGRGPIS